MRRRALLIPLLVFLLPLLAACNSTSLPGVSSTPAKPTATTQALEPTPTAEALLEPTATTVALGEPTATRPVVSEAPTGTVGATSSTPQPAETPSSVANAQLLRQIKQIEQDEVRLRGLPPLKDVPAQTLTEDQLRQNLTKDMADNYSEKESKQDVNALWLMRLIDDPTLDLYQLEIDLQTEQVAGYYDQTKHNLFVRNDSGSQTLPPTARETIAHEYTHAMQDQHYDLQKLLPIKNTDDDLDLGVRSLVEGDATITGLVYAQAFMSPKDYQTVIDDSKNAPTTVLDNAPRYIRDSLYFPYDQGVNFVITLGILNGYEPINKALQDPPVSSEQIIHPEKYTDKTRDLPKPVALTPLTNTLGAGWTMPSNGTLGEFDFQVMLEENNLDKSEADSAAGGWGGAVYNYYENGDKYLALFNTVWDTRKDADEFETAINDSFASYKKAGKDWTDGKRFFSVKRTGDAIAVGASTDQASLTKAMDALK